jgi:hypothetical protein
MRHPRITAGSVHPGRSATVTGTTPVAAQSRVSSPGAVLPEQGFATHDLRAVASLQRSQTPIVAEALLKD